MPPKKPKTRSSASRGRSKSAGRANSGSRDRPRSRSRQRSRERVPKRSRTPVSESKVTQRRRRSSSSDRSAGPTSSGDASKPKVAHPSRAGTTPYLRPLVRKLELEKSTPEISERFPLKKILQPTELCIPSRACPFTLSSPSFMILATIFVSLMVPFTIWLNLLVTNPTKAPRLIDKPTTHQSVYDFLGVGWPLDYHAYLNPYSFAFVCCYLLIHLLVVRFIPSGRSWTSSVSSQRKKYRYSGLAALVILASLFSLAQWSKWSVSKGLKPSVLLPTYWLSIVVSSCLIAVPLAIWVCFASKRVSRTTRQSVEKKTSCILDFYFGRDSRPNWLNLDWKKVIWRPCWFAVVLIDAAYLCRQFELHSRLSPSLVLLSAMHFILLLDFVIFGHSRKQNLGYFTIVQMLVQMPFLTTITTLYLSTKPDFGRWPKSVLPWNCSPCLVGTISFLFLVGYWIYRASKNQKNLFHREPHHPSLASLEIIAGPGSQRLLVGNWWGFVRHPDLVGEFLMRTAIAMTAGFESIIPWIYPSICGLSFIVRIMHKEATAAKEYGPAWSKYMGMVRSRFIPKIF